MPKYAVSYTVESWRKVFVEADNYEEASDKFWQGDIDFSTVVFTGHEIQDSVEIEEIP